MRFLGNIEAKIDAKGRAFLPAVFRKVLQTSGEENLVLRKDVFEDCLVLYPESVWNEQMDLVGRFLIPKRYLQLADIQQSIKFTGNGDTIEIWAAEKVEASMMSAADFGAAMQSVMDGELPPL